MIVDAHTHIFPPEVIERRGLYSKRDPSFAYIYENPKSRMVTYQELIQEMDKSGVNKAIVCGFPWRSLDLCRAHNDYMIEAQKAYPERLFCLAIVHPLAGKACERELERCFGEGLKGVGEISPEAQGFEIDDEQTMGLIVRAVQEADSFLLLHVNEEVGHSYSGKTPTTPKKAYRYLEKFPETKTVLAHWGGGLFFYELMPEVARLTSSVYYDTAASPFLYDSRIYRIALQIAGPGRIVFGTDFPLLRIKRHLDEIKDAQISPENLDAILGKNALCLVGHTFE
ncbi:MAG: amidohydrolase family protein [Actinomycetota bacterium]|nr:amidohydrolase family protein [Actinomycetota bacterium]